MRRIAAIARKELRQLGRDPLSLIMLLGLPAFMLVLYGYRQDQREKEAKERGKSR